MEILRHAIRTEVRAFQAAISIFAAIFSFCFYIGSQGTVSWLFVHHIQGDSFFFHSVSLVGVPQGKLPGYLVIKLSTDLVNLPLKTGMIY